MAINALVDKKIGVHSKNKIMVMLSKNVPKNLL